MKKLALVVGLAIVFFAGSGMAWGVTFTETFSGSGGVGLDWYIGDQAGNLNDPYDAIFKFDMTALNNKATHRTYVPGGSATPIPPSVNPWEDESIFDPMMYTVTGAWLDFYLRDDSTNPFSDGSENVAVNAFGLAFDTGGENDNINNEPIFREISTGSFSSNPYMVSIDLFDELMNPADELGDGSLNVRLLAGNIGGIRTDFIVDHATLRIDVAPVPEPATMVLLGLGIAGMIGMRRKFRK